MSKSNSQKKLGQAAGGLSQGQLTLTSFKKVVSKEKM